MQKYKVPTRFAPDKHIFCIGGANLDRKGSCINFLPRTSNIVEYHYSPGGVAWNVAASLQQLGMEARLITAVGNDSDGNLMLDLSKQAGFDTSYFIRKTHKHTGNYTSYHDEGGEMLFAFADMAIYSSITWKDIEAYWQAIKEASIVFIDTNLPADLIATLIEALSPLDSCLVIDPVSIAKATRLPKSLAGIDFLLPNEEEAYTIAGIALEERDAEAGTQHADIQTVAKAILDKGVKQVVITQGGQGLWYQDKNKNIQIPAYNKKVVDVTGAGDAFAAGLIYGLAIESDDPLLYGAIAASITVSSHKSVSEELQVNTIETILKHSN